MDFRTEKKFDLIEKTLSKITKYDDLTTIGDLIEKSKEVDSKEFKPLYGKKYLVGLNTPGLIALIMVTPVQKEPMLVYELISEIFYGKSNNNNNDDNNISINVNDTLLKVPEHYQFSIAMRFAYAASLCQKAQEALKLEGLNYLYKTNPTIYAAPILYIHAQIKDPLILDIRYRKTSKRIDTMTMYYLGLNYMLQKNFHEAELLFMKSYLLSKTCKDIRPSIIHKLSLASFLNRTPHEVFLQTIPHKHQPTGLAGSLWLLKPVNVSNFDGYYREFESEIAYESARRIVIDFAETSTAISAKDLAKACNIKQTELKKVLDDLMKCGDLVFTTTQDGIIQFTSVNVVQSVHQELDNVTKLYTAFKSE